MAEACRTQRLAGPTPPRSAPGSRTTASTSCPHLAALADVRLIHLPGQPVAPASRAARWPLVDRDRGRPARDGRARRSIRWGTTAITIGGARPGDAAAGRAHAPRRLPPPPPARRHPRPHEPERFRTVEPPHPRPRLGRRGRRRWSSAGAPTATRRSSPCRRTAPCCAGSAACSCTASGRRAYRREEDPEIRVRAIADGHPPAAAGRPGGGPAAAAALRIAPGCAGARLLRLPDADQADRRRHPRPRRAGARRGPPPRRRRGRRR